ncbi:tyrosine-type recombinase/integrase [Alteromonas macleodii]|uniref:Site-specific recombinase XerD n=1 Tax=Alteromonas macleodii TaxID=28108 RepID=A0A6T9Y279_ALTMA|nr:tyrosine-type recombinase/integrase [Alteromonas macleodii]CAB9494061.1 Site-specific recombinase XerD [Alteromonas macleodii]
MSSKPNNLHLSGRRMTKGVTNNSSMKIKKSTDKASYPSNSTVVANTADSYFTKSEPKVQFSSSATETQETSSLQVTSNDKSFENYYQQYYQDIFTKLPYNTQRAYISDYNEFAIFCRQHGFDGFKNDFEHNEICIKNYVEELCRSPLAYRTIKRRLSALSKFLGVAKLPNPIIRSAYLRDFIRLSLIENRKYRLSHKQAVPLTIDMVEQINNAIIPDSLLELRDLAIINLMFDALLRADELVRVCVEDISARNNTLLVVSSKSDQTGQGQYRYVSSSTISMVQEYINEANIDPKSKTQRLPSDLRGLHKGILFRRLTNHKTALLPFDENIPSHKANVLNYSSVYRIWQRIAHRAGISENITPHSGRVGGAVSLAEDGASLPELQLAGGWQSPEMPGHYTKQANVKRGGMAKLSAKRKR